MSYSAVPPRSMLCPEGVLLSISHDGDIELALEDNNFTADIVLSDENAGELLEWLTMYVKATKREGS